MTSNGIVLGTQALNLKNMPVGKLTERYFESSDIDFIIKTHGTPIFILDLHSVREQLNYFSKLFPDTDIRYSTKTNPHPAIMELVAAEGHGFDVATIAEIELALRHGAAPQKLLYTHPVKSEAEIQKAYALGVQKLTFDSLEELQRQHTLAPQAQHFLRVAPISNASLYDYKKKFGASSDELRAIMDYAIRNDIPIAGVSFMIGSQTMSINPWIDMLDYARAVIRQYYKVMPSLRTVNIGSGFPVAYNFDKVPAIQKIADAVKKLRKALPEDVDIIAEPGRFIVAKSTVLATRVIQRISRSGQEWLYTDANAYSGLIEIIESGGSFRYRITSQRSGPSTKYMIAGKTLDPDDILGSDIKLSRLTQAGDVLFVHDVGAYSSSFFTHYHSLPQPQIVVCDSEFTHNLTVGMNSIGVPGIRAKRLIKSGELVFKVSGHASPKRTRTTFQTSIKMHTEPTLFGAFLNHSCDPNVGIVSSPTRDGELHIVARRDIQIAEDIAADYAMFEQKTGPMAKVNCLCGSSLCRKNITGYKDLPPAIKQSYTGMIADHLKE